MSRQPLQCRYWCQVAVGRHRQSQCRATNGPKICRLNRPLLRLFLYISLFLPLSLPLNGHHVLSFAQLSFCSTHPCAQHPLIYYRVHCPVPLTARSALHFSPVHSSMNSTSLERIQPCCNNYIKSIHSHISTFVCIARNSFLHLSELTGTLWKEQNYPSFETWAKRIRTQLPSIVNPAFSR